MRKTNLPDVGEWLFERAEFERGGAGRLIYKRRNKNVAWHSATGGYDRFVVHVHPLDTIEQITANLFGSRLKTLSQRLFASNLLLAEVELQTKAPTHDRSVFPPVEHFSNTSRFTICTQPTAIVSSPPARGDQVVVP